MASAAIRVTPNMSVVFQNMDFGNDNDNTEYLIVNDFGNLDDLTLARFMRIVAEPIRTSPVYNVIDDDVAPVQAPNHLFLPPDAPPIAPDLLDIKNCTRQLELYNRVCMEIQDVDAQPLRYGRHKYSGAVRADRPGNRICYSYLKPGERLRVPRGTPKSVTRERQLNSLLRRMWFGYRYQTAMSFPAMNPKHMVYRIRPQGLSDLSLNQCASYNHGHATEFYDNILYSHILYGTCIPLGNRTNYYDSTTLH
jgi:hypothetical protein